MKRSKLKNREIKSKKSIKKIGGAKLGQGSYGCVITPPVKCLKNPYLRKSNFSIDDSFISKIIDTKYGEVSFSELNIGKKILSIDEEQNFLVPFINSCYFTPQKHIDIIYLKQNGRYVSSSPDSTELSDSIDDEESSSFKGSLPTKIIKENKNKCILSMEKDYINLFGINGGDNLNNILNLDKEHSRIKFVKKNYKYIFSYMIYGLYLLHTNNVIHRDIKPSNIVVSFEYLNDIIEIKDTHKEYENRPLIDTKFRFIDFGLSLFLNRRKYIMNDIIELFSNGTHYYTPMEIFAVRIISKLIKKHPNETNNYLDLMLLNTNKIYQKNRDYYHYEGIRNNFFRNKNEKTDLNQKENIYYLNPNKYENVFKHILNLYKNDKLEKMLPNILKGWDIYSLGITMAKIIIKCDIHDNEMNNIIFKMLDTNFEKRITIQQLAKLPVFLKYKRKFTVLHDLYTDKFSKSKTHTIKSECLSKSGCKTKSITQFKSITKSNVNKLLKNLVELNY